jgi:hypothetical protein
MSPHDNPMQSLNEINKKLIMYLNPKKANVRCKINLK